MKNRRAKNLAAGLVSSLLLASAVPVALNAGAADIKYGDVNFDGKVTIADSLAILQFVANADKYPLNEEAQDRADVFNRGDGITAIDAVSIQKFDTGLISELPESWAAPRPTDPTTEPTQPTTTEPPVQPTTVEQIDVQTNIHLKNNSISVEGEYATANGSIVTITHSGSYFIDGTLSDGQICVNIPDDKADPGTVKLILNGVDITGKSAPAILIQNADKTSITLSDGKVNKLTDGSAPYSGDNLDAAVIEAKDDLTIKGGDQGTGSLEINANFQTAVSCNNDIKITGGILTINTLDAENNNDAIKGKKSVTVKGGTVTIDSEGDGIKSSKGNVDIEGGDVSIKCGKDAIQAETAINISGGKIRAFGDKGLTCATAVNISGGDLLATATDNQTETFTEITQPTLVLDFVKEWTKNNPLSLTSGDSTVFDVNTTKKFRYAIISTPDLSASASYKLFAGGIQCTSSTGDAFKPGTPAKYTEVNNAEEGDLLYGDLFVQDVVHKIDVQMDQSKWNEFIANADKEEYYPCDVIIDGEKFENVGIRTKGNSSRMMVSQAKKDKFSLRIKLDKYEKLQNYHGLTELCMNNMFSDPSCMRDILCYSALDKIGGVGPNCAYTDMYLNGELYSFYFMAEQPGTTLAERLATSDDAVLYKATDTAGGGGWGGFGGGNDGYCSFTENMNLSNFAVKYGTDDNYEHIAAIKDAIGKLSSTNYKFIEDVIDVPSFLQGFAVNSVMCNYDSYNGTLAHNYYLMYTDGKAYFVGWDYNLALGNFMDNGSSVNSDVTTSLYQVEVKDRPLAKLLQVPEYYDMYVGYVKQIVDMYSNPETAINNYASIIRSHVKADPRFFFTADQFETNISKSATGLQVNTNTNTGWNWNNNNNNNNPGWNWNNQNNGNNNNNNQNFDWNNFDWNNQNWGGGFAGGGFGGFNMFGGNGGVFTFGGENVSIYDFLVKRMEIVRGQLGM